MFLIFNRNIMKLIRRRVRIEKVIPYLPVMRVIVFVVGLFNTYMIAFASSILVPMDESQQNHLKAYGVAYLALHQQQSVSWLLNFRGGSFLMAYSKSIKDECVVRGVSYQLLDDIQVNSVLRAVSNENMNMDLVQMERAPRIAVYSPRNDLISDESDAVILALEYAEIPYEIIYDQEVLNGALTNFDWLHLHHEDFTGQHGRFLRRESAIIQAKLQEALVAQLGFNSMGEMKLAVAKEIKTFCSTGGYLFAMCSAAETFDIALAAEGIDLQQLADDAESEAGLSEHLDYTKALAFEHFTLEPPSSRRFSDKNSGFRFWAPSGYFSLFSFSARWDLIPSLLTQNHETTIKSFRGQTTAFSKELVKPTVTVLAEDKNNGTVRYLYGELGKGHFTFYSGHDPEGVAGRDSKPTDLSLFPNSPGYRLILNNVLFPSAKKKKQKT